jgi:hypothetical protein
MMPPQPSDWGARGAANTAPANRQNTSPVYAPPGGYQPSVPPMYPQTIPPYAPPQKRSPIGWILAFIGMGLFVAVVVAVMVIARIGRNRIPPFTPPTPPVAQAGETALESNPDQVTVSGSDTILIKTFAMTPGSKFSIKNISGSVAVEGWDQAKAEVKVIKRGTDRGAQVFFANSANNLSLRTAIPSGNNSQDIRYEVKLPRNMGRVTLNSTNGSMRLTGITGQIFVEGTNGSIDLVDVTGVAKVQTTNGKIKAALQGPSDAPMEFSSTNGSIELAIKTDFDADLEASSDRGSINIDDQFGIAVQKGGFTGQQAHGAIGSGGQPLKIKTTNGSIRLTAPAKESGNGN